MNKNIYDRLNDIQTVGVLSDPENSLSIRERNQIVHFIREKDAKPAVRLQPQFSKVAVAAMVALLSGGITITAVAAGFLINKNTQRNYREFFHVAVEERNTDAPMETENLEANASILKNEKSGNTVTVEGAIEGLDIQVLSASRNDRRVDLELQMDFDAGVDVESLKNQLEEEQVLGQTHWLKESSMFSNDPWSHPVGGFTAFCLDGIDPGHFDAYGREDPIADFNAECNAEQDTQNEWLGEDGRPVWDVNSFWGEFEGDSLIIHAGIQWTEAYEQQHMNSHCISLEMRHLLINGKIHEGVWRCTYDMDVQAYPDDMQMTPIDLSVTVMNEEQMVEKITYDTYALTPNGLQVYGSEERYDGKAVWNHAEYQTNTRLVAWDDRGNYYVTYNRTLNPSQKKEEEVDSGLYHTMSEVVAEIGDDEEGNDYSGDTMMEDQGRIYRMQLDKDATILYVAIEYEIVHWADQGKTYLGTEYELATDPVNIHLKTAE